MNPEILPGLNAGRHYRFMQGIWGESSTMTLLMMVLLTNVAILITPTCIEGYGIRFGHTICRITMLLQIPGYLALIALCSMRLFSDQSRNSFTAGKSNSFRVRFRNTLMAVHLLLFASLLCGTFLMQRQVRTLADSIEDRIEVPNYRSALPGTPGLLRFFTL